ncbi:virion structural protein [Stenotrophomonas phage vB_SmaS-DLP_1]|uniref:F-like head morphogenesis protein n=1 Tax=Stenotrophomonas phage vB_SmaS-DLP_1 TaxID=1642588 RepID=A0A0M3MYY8_9CAUD|nr:head morphogenesis [Pseudomonas phage 73]YP_010597902.1 virion structural protein [Stenotrophomonas phage vB_SmaS-DLP_1]AKI28798.1 F-like head morphogenesis protein [Stenotrophomonas phage vB_SmaS-DLP_1]
MALSDNKRLYDIATRLAVYVEDVKVWQSRQFGFVLREVNLELTRLLGRVRYKTLDGLSKAQLNKLVSELRESQSKIYSAYTQTLLEQLKEFMRADLEVNRRAWVTGYIELDGEESDGIISDEEAIQFLLEVPNADSNPLFGLAAVTGSDERIWSQVTNTPIPANGLYLLPFIKTFTNSAQAGVESMIRKAWANRWTVEETLTALVGDGTAAQGTPSQLHRVNAQAASVIHTATAHVAAVVAAGVMSAVFGRYVWYSVIDGKTTDICISRNRRIYRFGEGPLPPAHIRCRSHVAPANTASDLAEETFYTWVARQPAQVQDDILGDDGGEALRDGRLKAKDIPKYDADRPLTYDEFRRKIKEILSR